MSEQELPTTVLLVEEGEWEMPSWSRDPDDEQWIVYGYKVTDQDGAMLYRNQHEQPVKDWLATKGYANSGDGYHYQKVEV